MVLPEEQEGKSEEAAALTRDPTPANATVNSRKGGGETELAVTRKVQIISSALKSIITY